MNEQRKKIFVAGHNGMVGSSILRKLRLYPDNDLVYASRNELDLMDQNQVFEFLGDKKIDEVYLAAAKVGGIYANNAFPAEFITENLCIQSNIIHGSYIAGIKKLLFLGSSCIYPKLAKQPMSEVELLAGKLEQTNEPYAIAKIAGLIQCKSYYRQYGLDYRSVMPTNLYGQGDNFHEKNSHVIPALMRRFHEAKIQNLPEVTVWGSGKAKREFIHVDDMAKACIDIMNLPIEQYNKEVRTKSHFVNIGSGAEVTIFELANLIKQVTGFKGRIAWDKTHPDGTPRKLLDVSLLNNLGISTNIELEEGIQTTYDWFLQNQKSFRK
jgi:GDP-L-fucose synthase